MDNLIDSSPHTYKIHILRNVKPKSQIIVYGYFYSKLPIAITDEWNLGQYRMNHFKKMRQIQKLNIDLIHVRAIQLLKVLRANKLLRELDMSGPLSRFLFVSGGSILESSPSRHITMLRDLKLEKLSFYLKTITASATKDLFKPFENILWIKTLKKLSLQFSFHSEIHLYPFFQRIKQLNRLESFTYSSKFSDFAQAIMEKDQRINTEWLEDNEQDLIAKGYNLFDNEEGDLEDETVKLNLFSSLKNLKELSLQYSLPLINTYNHLYKDIKKCKQLTKFHLSPVYREQNQQIFTKYIDLASSFEQVKELSFKLDHSTMIKPEELNKFFAGFNEKFAYLETLNMYMSSLTAMKPQNLLVLLQALQKQQKVQNLNLSYESYTNDFYFEIADVGYELSLIQSLKKVKLKIYENFNFDSLCKFVQHNWEIILNGNLSLNGNTTTKDIDNNYHNMEYLQNLNNPDYIPPETANLSLTSTNDILLAALMVVIDKIQKFVSTSNSLTLQLQKSSHQIMEVSRALLQNIKGPTELSVLFDKAETTGHHMTIFAELIPTLSNIKKFTFGIPLSSTDSQFMLSQVIKLTKLEELIIILPNVMLKTSKLSVLISKIFKAMKQLKGGGVIYQSDPNKCLQVLQEIKNESNIENLVFGVGSVEQLDNKTLNFIAEMKLKNLELVIQKAPKQLLQDHAGFLIEKLKQFRVSGLLDSVKLNIVQTDASYDKLFEVEEQLAEIKSLDETKTDLILSYFRISKIQKVLKLKKKKKKWGK